jgi:DHA2 family multidrug resistance protein
MRSTTPGPSVPADRVGAATWTGFAMMALGMFMAILDVQVVATSLPTIQSALAMAPDQMSWVQTAYLIAEVVAIPLTGLLTRVLTMRGLFVAAVSVFTVASLGCAASTGFTSLIAWRVLQGFSGGTLIPAVFSAVFLLFPLRLQGVATTLAGVLAVLAPTIGPVVGGWITETYSWHWLFLINLAPGVVAALVGALALPREKGSWSDLRLIDVTALALMAASLAALILGLKEAPRQGWTSPIVLGLLGAFVVTLALFIRRSWGAAHPIVELRTLRDRWFAVGCLLSFVLGIGLFGSVYMMPVFLAVSHGYGALRIGEIMLVTGVAQLLTAPIAVELEKRVDPRWLSLAGFLLFGLGLGLSAGESPGADFKEMFWPQVIRGVAIMLCLLPPTRMALGFLPPAQVPDASGLFNLMRNLGGAIGLALIDTVIYGRAPTLGRQVEARLDAGDDATAVAAQIPLDLFHDRPPGPPSADVLDYLAPKVERLATLLAINEAWALVAALTLLAVTSLLLLRGKAPAPPG